MQRWFNALTSSICLCKFQIPMAHWKQINLLSDYTAGATALSHFNHRSCLHISWKIQSLKQFWMKLKMNGGGFSMQTLRRNALYGFNRCLFFVAHSEIHLNSDTVSPARFGHILVKWFYMQTLLDKLPFHQSGLLIYSGRGLKSHSYCSLPRNGEGFE